MEVGINAFTVVDIIIAQLGPRYPNHNGKYM